MDEEPDHEVFINRAGWRIRALQHARIGANWLKPNWLKQWRPEWPRIDHGRSGGKLCHARHITDGWKFDESQPERQRHVHVGWP